MTACNDANIAIDDGTHTSLAVFHLTLYFYRKLRILVNLLVDKVWMATDNLGLFSNEVTEQQLQCLFGSFLWTL